MYGKTIINILCIIWIITLIYAIYGYIYYYNNQDRSFKIVGLSLDFSKNKDYTIGGIPNNMNRLIDNAPADIWLPTGLLPCCIGVLQFKNDILTFKPNNFVQNEQAVKIIEKVCYPLIYDFENPEIVYNKSSEEIDELTLHNGIVLNYPTNVSMKIIVSHGSSPGLYELFFEPRPNHLRYELPNYSENGSEIVELSFNNSQSESIFNGNIQLIRFRSSETNIKSSLYIEFKDEAVFLNNDEIAKTDEIFTIPGTKVLAIFSGYRNLNMATIFVLLFYILFFILFILLRMNAFKSNTKWEKVVQLLSSPIFIIGCFYHFGIILSFHYIFKYPFYNSREYFITSGGICIILLISVSFFVLAKNIVFFKYVNRLSKWIFENRIIYFFFIPYLITSLFFADYLAANTERFFGIPAHALGRINLLIALFVLPFVSPINRIHGVFLLLYIMAYVLLLNDFGFALYILPTLALIYFLFDKSRLFLALCFMVFIIGFTLFYIFPNAEVFDRFHLWLNNYNGIWIEEIISTEQHKATLEAVFSGPKKGLIQPLNIPPGMRNVFFSDYVILFAFSLFRGLPFLAIFSILSYIFFVQLIAITFLLPNYPVKVPQILFRNIVSKLILSNPSKATILQNSYVLTGKYFVLAPGNIDRIKGALILKSMRISHRLTPIYIGLAFVILSYVGQVFYMFGATMRAFPFTGQSIPFLSVSIVEPILFSCFMIFSFILFKYAQNDYFISEEIEHLNRHIKKIKFSSFLAILIILIIGMTRIAISSKQVQSESSRYPAEWKGAKDINKILFEIGHYNNNFVEFLKFAECVEIRDICKKYNMDEKLLERQIISSLARHFWGQDNRYHFENNKFLYNADFSAVFNPQQFKNNLLHNTFISTRLYQFSNNCCILKKDGDNYFLCKINALDHPVSSFYTSHNIMLGSPHENGDLLVNETSGIYSRIINGQKALYYYNADIFGILPDIYLYSNESAPDQIISIDSGLQALLYALLHNYSISNKIKAGAIVVIDNVSGYIKAMVSFPNFTPNCDQIDKDSFVADLNLKGINVYRNVPNIALSGYNIGSTWKFIQASAAALADSSTLHFKFSCLGQKRMDVRCAYNHNINHFVDINRYLTFSCNHYSKAFLFNIFKNNTIKQNFLFQLRDTFGVRTGKSVGNEYYKYASSLNSIKDYPEPFVGNLDEKDLPRDDTYLAHTSIGGQDINISILSLTVALCRVITGKKIFPRLIINENNQEFKAIEDVNGTLPKIRTYLANATDIGTARKIRATGIFSRDVKVYSKTGTLEVGTDEHTLIVFGTDNYSFGIFLFNNPGIMTHATDFSCYFLNPLKTSFPDYLR